MWVDVLFGRNVVSTPSDSNAPSEPALGGRRLLMLRADHQFRCKHQAFLFMDPSPSSSPSSSLSSTSSSSSESVHHARIPTRQIMISCSGLAAFNASSFWIHDTRFGFWHLSWEPWFWRQGLGWFLEGFHRLLVGSTHCCDNIVLLASLVSLLIVWTMEQLPSIGCCIQTTKLSSNRQVVPKFWLDNLFWFTNELQRNHAQP